MKVYIVHQFALKMQIYRMSEEKRTVFWEVTVWAILGKSVYVRVSFPNVCEIEPFHCTVPKLLIRKRYYVLFLMPAFIVQVTKLVQFI
jgi:hypothetical protein